MKNDLKKISEALKHEKIISLLAPSFIAEFDYPQIVCQLKHLGFDKVVELTFGAKMINREYHSILKKEKGLVISSVCPGIVEIISKELPNFKKNIMLVDSPMIATAKICKKIYPKHKTLFIAPCHFKKIEAEKSKYLDYVLDFQQLKQLFKQQGLENPKSKGCSNIHDFDKFYNEYTRIYPLSGGLSKTAHLKGVLKPGEELIIDGIGKVKKFLENPSKKIRFLDATFCIGGCIGGPCLSSSRNLTERKQRLLAYLKHSKTIPMKKYKRGIIERAKGIKFTS